MAQVGRSHLRDYWIANEHLSDNTLKSHSYALKALWGIFKKAKKTYLEPKLKNPPESKNKRKPKQTISRAVCGHAKCPLRACGASAKPSLSDTYGQLTQTFSAVLGQHPEQMDYAPFGLATSQYYNLYCSNYRLTVSFGHF